MSTVNMINNNYMIYLSYLGIEGCLICMYFKRIALKGILFDENQLNFVQD